MGFLGRLFRRLAQTDEERLAADVLSWAETVPGTTRIAGCPSREPVRVAGVVRRLTLKPGEAFEAVVSDGTGEVTAVWTGRSRVPGLGLGTRVTLEGVLGRDRDRVRMVNPRYEFAA